VDRETVLATIYQTAAEFAASNGRAVSADSVDADDNLLELYGFTSLDALEYLLVLEEKFGITFEDDELNDAVLRSASALADYVMAQDARSTAS
jgi:acyl carrier protein